MKTIVLIATCLLVGGGLASCGGSSNSSTSQPEATTSTAGSQKHGLKLRMSKGEIARLPKLEIKMHKAPAPKKLVVRDLRRGTGAQVQPNCAILVDFFDVKYGSAQNKSWSGKFGPTQFGYTGTIKGWQVGLRGMRVGGRRELVVPPSLGYEGKTIVYVIDLLAVYPGEASSF